jgi:hypothetical protein
MDVLDQLEKDITDTLGNLSRVESKATTAVQAGIAKIEQWRQTRDYETRTPEGRLEHEDELLAEGIAAETEADETVRAARALAERIASAAFEPGAYRYGDHGYDPEVHRPDEPRFTSIYVTLADTEHEAYNRTTALVAEDVDAARTAADLERLLDAAAGDRGRLFATARAIERRYQRNDGAPTSERIRQTLDVAWETLRDPRRARLRERVKALRERTEATSKTVWNLRRDELAREQARKRVGSYF